MSISFLSGNIRVRFAGRTDVGQVRAHNEDSIHVPEEMALGVVADGMGGHAAGDVASRIAVETVVSYFRATAEYEPTTFPLRLPQLEIERNRMATAIKMANSNIFETAAADADKKGMGTTVDALFVGQGRCYIGHVGDSRVYRVRDGSLGLVTEDHSLLNDWRRMKEMSGEEVQSFPHKNVVVRALGLAESVNVDVLVEEAAIGDLYLLCSDGLSDMLSDDEIMGVIRAGKRLDSIASKLVDAANEAGGKDNITALLVSLEKP